MCNTDSEDKRRKRQSGSSSTGDLDSVPSAVDAENEFLTTFMGVSNDKKNVQCP